MPLSSVDASTASNRLTDRQKTVAQSRRLLDTETARRIAVDVLVMPLRRCCGDARHVARLGAGGSEPKSPTSNAGQRPCSSNTPETSGPGIALLAESPPPRERRQAEQA